MITYTFYHTDGSTRLLRLTHPLTQVEHKGKIVNVLDQLAEYWGASLTPLVKVEVPPTPLSERLKAKQALKTAIHGHKNIRKHKPLIYAEYRNSLLKSIVTARPPNWGSVRISEI